MAIPALLPSMQSGSDGTIWYIITVGQITSTSDGAGECASGGPHGDRQQREHDVDFESEDEDLAFLYYHDAIGVGGTQVGYRDQDLTCDQGAQYMGRPTGGR